MHGIFIQINKLKIKEEEKKNKNEKVNETRKEITREKARTEQEN